MTETTTPALRRSGWTHGRLSEDGTHLVIPSARIALPILHTTEADAVAELNRWPSLIRDGFVVRHVGEYGHPLGKGGIRFEISAPSVVEPVREGYAAGTVTHGGRHLTTPDFRFTAPVLHDTAEAATEHVREHVLRSTLVVKRVREVRHVLAPFGVRLEIVPEVTG